MTAERRAPEEPTDTELVLRGQLGDRAALGALVARWHEPVHGLLRQLVLDDHAADDLTQEVWLEAMRSLAGLREPERLRPWLFTIARRRAVDRLRRRYRRPERVEAPDELPEPPGVDAGDPAGAVVDRTYVTGLLGELEPDLRIAVALVHLQGCSVAEAAEIVGVPEGTVKSRLHRARRRLAAAAGEAPRARVPSREESER
ncbi:MAG: RNA polymerase sigma factor [Actinomycetota bacterium]|nr:RNA polymerase sigma factor [Actinomycetota bacterium]